MCVQCIHIFGPIQTPDILDSHQCALAGEDYLSKSQYFQLLVVLCLGLRPCDLWPFHVRCLLVLSLFGFYLSTHVGETLCTML